MIKTREKGRLKQSGAYLRGENLSIPEQNDRGPWSLSHASVEQVADFNLATLGGVVGDQEPTGPAAASNEPVSE